MAVAESDVATKPPVEGKAKASSRSNRGRRLSTGRAKPATGDEALRGELVQARPKPSADSAEGSSDFERTSIRANLPGPWRYRDPSDGSVVCSEKLIAENLNLARKYAWNWSKKSSFDYSELEALAYLGLIKGVRKFDPRLNYKLSTICVPYINGEILHYFRDKGYAIKYPSRWREIMPKARKRLEAGEDPSVIAESLEMTLRELEEMLGSMCGTSELRDEVVGQGEAELELNLLKPLILLADRAWKRMAWCDQKQVTIWWEANKRRAAIPRQQLSSFNQAARHMLEGRPLPEVRDQLCFEFDRQTELLIGKPGKKQQKSRKKRRTKKELEEARTNQAELDARLLQMGLGFEGLAIEELVDYSLPLLPDMEKEVALVA